MARTSEAPDTLIAAIRARLAALQALSPEKPHLYTVGAAWSEPELARFERTTKVVLPAGYRAYLEQIGDGGAGFLWHGHDTCGGLAALRALTPAERKRLSRRFPLTARTRKFPPD